MCPVKNRFERESGLKQRRRKLRLNLRNIAFHLRDCRRDVDARLAAGMLRCTFLAITRHFLAARHLRLRHSLGWQASKRGNSRPHDEQSEDGQ